MTKSEQSIPARRRRVFEAITFMGLVCASALSAVLAKEYGSPPVLASVTRGEPVRLVRGEPRARPLVEPGDPVVIEQDYAIDPSYDATRVWLGQDEPGGGVEPRAVNINPDHNVRWFNGRMVRPVRVVRMKVTAYSPDQRSCGKYADGQTATLHSVWTNGMKLVAADTAVLPYGSMVSVPGYDNSRIVPVLDCGGAIKGKRLDVLFPTHEAAREWGVRTLDVVVWGYADGSPIDNPRELR